MNDLELPVLQGGVQQIIDGVALPARAEIEQ